MAKQRFGRVRGGVLMGARELIGELGGDAVRLARGTGIDPIALSDHDFPVLVENVIRFVARGAEVLDCETFGLQLSLRQELSLFGPLAALFENATTIGRLVRDIVDYFPLHTKGSVPSIEPGEQGQWVNYELAAGIGRSHRQVVELGLGVLVGELRRLQPSWRPSELHLRHAPPENLALHRRIFGSHVRFNADRNALFIEDALLARPYGRGDARLHRALSLNLDRQRRSLPDRARARTENLVRNRLPYAPCGLDDVARQLKLPRRSLQRQLAQEGTGFGEILDSVRADLALYYLRESELSVAAVAEILQFSETSALTRAFRRWYGIPPRRARSGQSRRSG